MVTKDGQPVECFLTPGSYSDGQALQPVQCNLPEGSCIYADKAYNDAKGEDILLAAAHVQRCPMRKKNSKRALPPYIADVYHSDRNMIETVGRLIERMLPNTIHAVTAEGFALKVFLLVLAYSINCL